jgi:hypothetical protein
MKKITLPEDNLKQDEYKLYINAPSYENQRARMEFEIKRNKELLRLQKQRNNYLYILLVIVIAIFVILLMSCNPKMSNIIIRKQLIYDNISVYYFGDYKFFSDSTRYEPGDTVKDLHEISYKVKVQH